MKGEDGIRKYLLGCVISFREKPIDVRVDFSWFHSIPVEKVNDRRTKENVVISPIEPLRNIRTS